MSRQRRGCRPPVRVLRSWQKPGRKLRADKEGEDDRQDGKIWRAGQRGLRYGETTSGQIGGEPGRRNSPVCAPQSPEGARKTAGMRMKRLVRDTERATSQSGGRCGQWRDQERTTGGPGKDECGRKKLRGVPFLMTPTTAVPRGIRKARVCNDDEPHQ